MLICRRIIHPKVDDTNARCIEPNAHVLSCLFLSCIDHVGSHFSSSKNKFPAHVEYILNFFTLQRNIWSCLDRGDVFKNFLCQFMMKFMKIQDKRKVKAELQSLVGEKFRSYQPSFSRKTAKG